MKDNHIVCTKHANTVKTLGCFRYIIWTFAVISIFSVMCNVVCNRPKPTHTTNINTPKPTYRSQGVSKKPNEQLSKQQKAREKYKEHLEEVQEELEGRQATRITGLQYERIIVPASKRVKKVLPIGYHWTAYRDLSDGYENMVRHLSIRVNGQIVRMYDEKRRRYLQYSTLRNAILIKPVVYVEFISLENEPVYIYYSIVKNK